MRAWILTVRATCGPLSSPAFLFVEPKPVHSLLVFRQLWSNIVILPLFCLKEPVGCLTWCLDMLVKPDFSFLVVLSGCHVARFQLHP